MYDSMTNTVRLRGVHMWNTEADLMEDLRNKDLLIHRPLICKTESGHWTAVFSWAFSKGFGVKRMQFAKPYVTI